MLEAIQNIIAGIIAAIVGLVLSLTGGAALGVVPPELDEINGLQATYFAQHGKYLQIRKGNRLSSNETGTVKEKLGKDIDPEYVVNVYKEPESSGGEWGYQVKWEDEFRKYSSGVGQQKDIRDYSFLKPVYEATTTSLFSPFFTEALAAFTTNTHSTDLERDSSQAWSDADNASLSITGDLTATFYAQFESDPGGGVSVIAKWRYSGASHRSYDIGFLLGSANNPMNMVVSDDGTGNSSASVDYAGFETGAWHHFGYVYDASAGTVDFYVDGSVLGTQQSGMKTSIDDNGSTFCIGVLCGDNSPTDTPMDGDIDDVRIWSRELTSTEISDLFADPCNFDNGSNLEGEWHFDNDGLDETANNNNLTSENSAGFTTDFAYTCLVAGEGFNEIQIISIKN